MELGGIGIGIGIDKMELTPCLMQDEGCLLLGTQILHRYPFTRTPGQHLLLDYNKR